MRAPRSPVSTKKAGYCRGRSYTRVRIVYRRGRPTLQPGNIMKQAIRYSLCAALVTVSAHAGSVINTNLPAGTTIVNIDARADGANAYDGPQSLWYQPVAAAPSVTLTRGTYQFRVIDP